MKRVLILTLIIAAIGFILRTLKDWKQAQEINDEDYI
jgi:hypothetical protein